MPAPSGDRAARAAIRRLPCWRGRPVIRPLPGGLSNRNYAVRDRAGAYVARLTGGDRPEHGIFRAREIAASRAAFAAGIAPEPILARRGIMVVRRLAGAALTPQAVHEPPMLDRIADLLARMHRSLGAHLDGPAGTFAPFRVVRGYIARLDRLGLATAQHAAWRGRLGALERAAGALPRVFTHNDLMPGNLIDDGARLWLIDWEFAGYGAPLFDLAGVAVNNGLDARRRRRLLARYLGRPPRPDEIRRFAAYRLAASLRESLWGSVQGAAGGLDFDYAGYAAEHAEGFERAARNFDAGRFA